MLRPDAPERITALARSLIGGGHAGWGAAMLGELDRIESRRERWAFALGCLRASVLVAPWRPGPGRSVTLASSNGAVVAAGVVGFGLARYPALVTGAGTWVALAAFLVVLVGYTLAGRVLAPALGGPSGRAVRSSLLGVVVLTAGWVLLNVLSGSDLSGYVVTLLVALVPLAAAYVGVTATWRDGGDVRTGLRACGLLAVLAGLAVFVAWAGETVVDGGRPYDAGQLRDFPGSGAPDLATYAVSDNLGTAMVLLVLVPLLVVAIGLATALLTGTLRPRAPG
ncbi:MAG: hypothetical protein JWO46_193 [Nocardioidaceae bacterium]|nr:hypothetical protein [Nocardioidaceae bacterium]